jgi:hypothetical protein
MALRGSSIQAPDLRDIPLPRITVIPVGIKFIGKSFTSLPSKPEIIARPVSYLALSYLLSSFTRESPFGGPYSITKKIIENIPESPYVSENEDIRIIKKGEDYFLYGKEKKWTKLPPSALK